MSYSLGTNIAETFQPFNASTVGGDVSVNSEFNYGIAQLHDFFSISLHESGYSFGLEHTPGTVMNSTYNGTLIGLSADDVAGIQSIYGARDDDVHDQVARNDTISSATALGSNLGESLIVPADITNEDDVDYFRLVSPEGTDGMLIVTVDVDQLSLLAPLVQIFDAAGKRIAWAHPSVSHGRNVLASADTNLFTPTVPEPITMSYDGSGQFMYSAFAPIHGISAQVRLDGISEGETFYLSVEGATNDGFGMGAYNLEVQFGPTSQPPWADAGDDQTVVLPSLASLDGTVSDVGIQGTLNTTWSAVSGPGSVTFGDADAVDTTAGFTDAGTYILRLSVSDGVLTAIDEVTITVQDPLHPSQLPAVTALYVAKIWFFVQNGPAAAQAAALQAVPSSIAAVWEDGNATDDGRLPEEAQEPGTAPFICKLAFQQMTDSDDVVIESLIDETILPAKRGMGRSGGEAVPGLVVDAALDGLNTAEWLIPHLLLPARNS